MAYRKNGLLSDMLASSKRLNKTVILPPAFYSLPGTFYVHGGASDSTNFVFKSGYYAPTSIQWYYSGSNVPGSNVLTLSDTSYGSNVGTHSFAGSVNPSTSYWGTISGITYDVAYFTISASFSDTSSGGDMLTFRNSGDNPTYKPVTGWYKCVISNSAGSADSGWFLVRVQSNPYQCNCLGQDCGCCYYDCNCQETQVENCCCYDCSGDGITCCDGNNACNSGPEWCGCCRGECSPGDPGSACGYHTEYTNCSQCQDCCYYNCTDSPCNHNCAYTSCDTCWSDTTSEN